MTLRARWLKTFKLLCGWVGRYARCTMRNASMLTNGPTVLEHRGRCRVRTGPGSGSSAGCRPGIEIKHKKWESVGVLEGQQKIDQCKPKAAVYHIDGSGPAVAAEMHELDALVRPSHTKS